MKKQKTLNAYLHLLTPEEKRYLCFLLNIFKGLPENKLKADVHPGLLPFVPLQVLLKILNRCYPNIKRNGLLSEIIHKLRKRQNAEIKRKWSARVESERRKRDGIPRM